MSITNQTTTFYLVFLALYALTAISFYKMGKRHGGEEWDEQEAHIEHQNQIIKELKYELYGPDVDEFDWKKSTGRLEPFDVQHAVRNIRS